MMYERRGETSREEGDEEGRVETIRSIRKEEENVVGDNI